MASFDPTYLSLVGATAATAALVLAARVQRRERRVLVGLLAGLLLVETGLIVLVWSRLACWVLVAAGAGLVAWASPLTTRRTSVAALVVPATAGGLWFQFAPEPLAFHIYLGGVLPLLLAAAFALVASRWLQWGGRGLPAATLVAAGGAVFAGFVPASMFAPAFLRRFELFHLPVALVLLAALAWMAFRGVDRVDEARRAVFAAGSVGAYAGRRPLVEPRTVAIAVAASGVLALALVPWAGTVGSAGVATMGALATAGVTTLLVSLAAHGRGAHRIVHSNALVTGAGLAFASAVGATVVIARDIGEQGAWAEPAGVALYAGGAVAAVAGFAAALALALVRDARARRFVQRTDARLLDGTLVLQATLPHGSVIDVAGPGDALLARARALGARLRAVDAPVGILRIDAPSDDPFWTLTEDEHAWLVDPEENDPGHRVHVAVHEAGSTYLVPPLVPEEVGP